MSVQIETVEFEQREAYLSSLEDGPPYTVHGIALGSGDITVGQSGVKKLWPDEELAAAADTLEGTNLVEDHENSSRGVVGRVTKAGYKDGVGVIYEAELFDEELAESVNDGLLEVSIRGRHTSVENMEEHSESGAKIVENITFENLSIVPTGASPSNTLEMGEAAELSLAELSSFTDQLAQEIEPGMWVQSDDMHGIVLSPEQDGEVEVDVYEKSDDDDKWRAIGETMMVSTNSLSEWDVDEDDVGSAADDDEEEAADHGIPEEYIFDSEESAMDFIEGHDGLTGVHEMDMGWVPGDTHQELLDWMDSTGEEMAAVDDKVSWQDGAAQGIIRERKTDGCFNEKIDGDHEICASEDDAVVLIEIVKDGEPTGTMVAHKESTVSSADFEMSGAVDPPEFEEGMMVEWQVNPDMFGKIVHNPDDGNIMVEVMEMDSDGEPVSTGHTLTAAPPDLMPMSEDTMAEQESMFDDYPEAASENAQMALDARDDTDNPRDCGTSTGWKRANQLANGDPVSREVVGKMAAFNRHRQNSDMSDDEGRADCGWMMWKAWGGDEGVDWAKRKMESIEEAAEATDEGESDKSDVATELQEVSVHEPSFSGMTESEWSKPDMEDFGEDADLDTIADHFLMSMTGFPPENYTDLKLPVVEPNGNLSLNALQNAKARASQTDGLSGDDLDRAVSIINSLANEEFDADFAENRDGNQTDIPDFTVHTGDTKVDNLTQINTMNVEEIEEKLAELSEPVAVEQTELEDLQEKADQFEDMNSTLEDLRERTDILDEVDRSQVEELSESDDPMVVESTHYEELSEEAEQVAAVYAEALSDEYDIFDADELTDRYSIEELREKYEENIGSTDELAVAPKSGDVDEEELETETEELESDEDVQAKQDELREKIVGGR